MSDAAVSPALEVLDAGFLTSVQDLGRPRAMPLGVPEGGACDRWSLAVANLRCGNERGAAALELTVLPPRLRARRPTTIAVAGADLGLRIRGPSGDAAVRPGAVATLRPGDVLGPDDGPLSGCRAYLAVRGGIRVAGILGSASTALTAGFGGLAGRALRVGDVLEAPDEDVVHDSTWVPAIAFDASLGSRSTSDVPIGLLPGPDGPATHLLDPLVTEEWTVAPTSDRMGLRLEGPPLPAAGASPVASHGVTWGTVQVPPDGRPIVLLADHQPTGGYPVPAMVPIADHPRLAQLRPGDRVRFGLVTIDAALQALRREHAALDAVERACRDDRAWDEAWRWIAG